MTDVEHMVTEAMATVGALRVTQQYQQLLAALRALEAALREPVEASAFGTEVAFAVYEEARHEVADEIAALLTEHDG